jgi:spore coat polysaccharide biosynthesis protein SpsF
MTTLVVVQARMGSTRLPGKVLRDLGGRPVLVLLLERLLAGALDADVVVATSDLGGDDPVVATARAAGVDVVRGPEQDVLARFTLCLDRHPADAVVRITADCPLTDPALVAEAVDLHRRTGADYTSNTLVRTYPDGLDVEVLRADALRAADAEATDAVEREHVTPFVYRRPERFQLRALRQPNPLGDERWTLDTADDLADLDDVVGRLRDPVGAGWQEILAVIGRRRPPSDGALWLRPLDTADLDRIDPVHRPALSAADDLDDPATRRWATVRDRAVLGWMAVTTASGQGRLTGWVPEAERAEARALLDRALTADAQVTDLTGTIAGTPG